MMRQVKFEVTFSVAVETKHGEIVCLTGDGSLLGDWSPDKAQHLHRDTSITDREVWSLTLKLDQSASFSYRYFTCLKVEADHEEEDGDIVVTRWETNIAPRRFSPHEESEQEAIFGKYGGRTSIDKGWLTGQTEVHIRLHNNPIHMWQSRYQQQTYSIKCTPMDLRYKDASMDRQDGDNFEDDDDYEDTTTGVAGLKNVEVSVLTQDSAPPTADQGEYGVTYRENDYVVFKAQAFEPEFVGFTLDFYMQRNSIGHCPPKHVGYAYVLPVNFKETMGRKSVPISGLKHRPIGQIFLEYLIVKPLLAVPQTMKQTYARHWKLQRRPLDVGHRGMGSSYKSLASIRENTIASLAAAGSHGADMVEFDVQLTKDLVPVIYHDFTVCLTMRKKSHPSEQELFKVPVRDLTYAQLQQLRLLHASELKEVSENNNDVTSHHQPFPTLRQCFDELDTHIGFNIEVKYAMLEKSGDYEEEQEHYTERNMYLDHIIKEVLQHAGTRRIIFSCFDPDVCILLRRKQNKYPVLFLTLAMSPKYATFEDLRTQNVDIAMRFSLSESLLGINVHTEELLANKSYIKSCKERGIILFCWGDDNNDTSNIKELKDLGVDGVIYDRINEFKASKDNVFKMEHEAKRRLLHDMGRLPDSDSSDNDSVVPKCS